jgi:5-methylcytosine-specific restriction endonuclease McrA
MNKAKVKGAKCNRCGSKKYLLVHHKDRDRENNDDSNLEVLCKACHQKEHVVRGTDGKFHSAT